MCMGQTGNVHCFIIRPTNIFHSSPISLKLGKEEKMGSSEKKIMRLESKTGSLFKVKNLLAIYMQFPSELYFIK